MALICGAVRDNQGNQGNRANQGSDSSKEADS